MEEEEKWVVYLTWVSSSLVWGDVLEVAGEDGGSISRFSAWRYMDNIKPLLKGLRKFYFYFLVKRIKEFCHGNMPFGSKLQDSNSVYCLGLQPIIMVHGHCITFWLFLITHTTISLDTHFKFSFKLTEIPPSLKNNPHPFFVLTSSLTSFFPVTPLSFSSLLEIFYSPLPSITKDVCNKGITDAKAHCCQV